MKHEIGFIGLGQMGAPIAANLIDAGYRLRVHNRTAAKAAPLTALGAIAEPDVAAVARPGAIVVTMVADDAALEEIVTGAGALAAGIAPGGIHLSLSTIAPATARRLAAIHAASGSAYVAAPVFGRPDAARARRLSICVSGPEDKKQVVQPILDAIGRAVFDFGADPGAANVAKLCGNFLIAAAMEAMGEAFAMARKSGLEPIAVAEMLAQALFTDPVYRGYGAAIARRQHTPAGFTLALGLKDLELVLDAARAVRAPMPAANLARDRILAALARGRDGMDWSALALGAADDAGLN